MRALAILLSLWLFVPQPAGQGAVVLEEITPLPDGMRCAYLPAVGVP